MKTFNLDTKRDTKSEVQIDWDAYEAEEAEHNARMFRVYAMVALVCFMSIGAIALLDASFPFLATGYLAFCGIGMYLLTQEH